MDPKREFLEKLRTYRPKSWDELPDAPMFIDQLISVVNSQFLRPEEDPGLTVSMVNNYSKASLMPKANGKRYHRDHIAYLTGINILKRFISTKDLDLLIRTELENSSHQNRYQALLDNFDAIMNTMAGELDSYLDGHSNADGAIHFALISYAANLISDYYLHALKEEPKGDHQMRDYVIMTDSCADLTAEEVKELDLSVVSLRFTMNDKTYVDTPEHTDMSVDEFYRHIADGVQCTTSAVNVGDYLNAMRPILEQGKDIFCVAFSSGLSSTYSAGVMAAEELKEEFPDAKIIVIDSLAASRGQGMLVYRTVMEKRKGLSIDELAEFVTDARDHQGHWFSVNDLNHLHRGGRLSAASAVVGSMLSIKPVLHVDEEGKLINRFKARGMKGAVREMVNQVEALGKDYDLKNQPVFISHAAAPDYVELLKKEMTARFGCEDYRVGPIGPVIGSHTGCGTIAVFFVGSGK